VKEHRRTSLLSRRNALRTLLRSPQALFPEESNGHASIFALSEPAAQEVLPQYSAVMSACWQLSRGPEFSIVEQALPLYIQRLEQLARGTLQEHQLPVVAHLTAQGYQLGGILAFHRNLLAAREEYCRRSVRWARLAADPTLLVAVIATAGVTFHYTGQPTLALQIYQEAFPTLDRASPLAQGSLYMKQAEAYAKLGLQHEAEQSLSRAYRVFPPHPSEDPAFLYADCGAPSLCLWDGLTYLARSRTQGGNKRVAQGLARRAWEAFELCGGTRPATVISERNYLEILNHQAETAIVLDDLELFLAFFPQVAGKAKAFSSQRRHKEAIAIYWQARRYWPHEERIKELAELFL
jgi:tetratricopeptide (TPR) repeat protein